VLRALEWLKLNIHLYKDWMAVNQTPQRDTLSVEWHAVLYIGDERSDLHLLQWVVVARQTRQTMKFTTMVIFHTAQACTLAAAGVSALDTIHVPLHHLNFTNVSLIDSVRPASREKCLQGGWIEKYDDRGQMKRSAT
jgi:hypothetical protein